MKRALGIVLAGLIGAGTVFSGAAVTGVTTELTAFAAGDVAVNATNFPDENFRSYVSENIDTDSDGKLSESEIAACDGIECSWSNISSLKGIEHFKELKTLTCNDNNLSSLDISKNTALQNLFCCSNNLSSLDISKNTALTYLDCGENRLKSLDVSKNTALTYLDCRENNLSSLDVSKNTALNLLSCFSNNLSSLDVSKNTALNELHCRENNLSSLDVSNNTALWWLECSSNNLGSLDLSKNITVLGCRGNNLSSLDVSKNKELCELDCSENNLICLDVSKNTELWDLNAKSQAKDVIATNGEILLSSLSPNIVASNITNIKGATLSGDKFTNITDDTITYDYETGYYEDETMDVTLNVTNIEREPDPIPVTFVDIEDSHEVMMQETVKLDRSVKPSNATNKKLHWESADPSIATVDNNGKVKGVSPGTTIITATTDDGGFTDTCEVTVLDMTKIPFYYPSGDYKDGTTKDVKDTCYYSDRYFDEASNIYRDDLASASLCLTLSAFSSNVNRDSKYDEEYRNARRLLIGDANKPDTVYMGFDSFHQIGYNDNKTENSIAAVIAKKPIVSNGKDYTLLAVAVRGGGYGAEWAGNFNVGLSGEHAGFNKAKTKVLDFIKNYIKSYDIKGDIKLWITGYSRGAATANLVAGSLTNDPGQLSNVTLAKKDLYAYTFATPQGALKDSVKPGSKYTNIHNIISKKDLVPRVAMSSLIPKGFQRYGVDHFLPDRLTIPHYKYWNMEDKMLKQYYSLDSNDALNYKLDAFEFLELGVKGVKTEIWGMEVDLPDLNHFENNLVHTNYDIDQSSFVDNFVSSITKENIKTRSNYVVNFQNIIMILMNMMNLESSENFLNILGEVF